MKSFDPGSNDLCDLHVGYLIARCMHMTVFEKGGLFVHVDTCIDLYKYILVSCDKLGFVVKVNLNAICCILHVLTSRIKIKIELKYFYTEA